MKRGFKRCLLASAFALGCMLASAQPAAAASGVVSGVLLFYQNQGNFCPASRNCTGAKYTQAEYNTNQPFRNARIYVTRRSDGAILGQGVTDLAGFFSVAWFDPSVGPFTSVSASLEYKGEHADGRYFFAEKLATFDDPPLRSGLPVVPLRHDFTATPGFSWLNFPTFGNAMLPSDLAQMHDGAHKMWFNSLSQSFLMLLLFGDLEIQFFSDFICANNCAVGDSNLIVIGSSNLAISPQGSVMHEMGHIASYLSNTDWTLYNAARNVFTNDYSRDGSLWTFTSREFEGVAWEEAVATHHGDVALYYPWAAQPFTCNNPGACPAVQDSLNVALEPTDSCGFESSRMAGSHMRYHWDLYDSSADYFGETVSIAPSEVIDTVGNYWFGSGETGIDETWNLPRTALDDPDGRSTRDFANYLLLRGINSNTALATNCGSAGD